MTATQLTRHSSTTTRTTNAGPLLPGPRARTRPTGPRSACSRLAVPRRTANPFSSGPRIAPARRPSRHAVDAHPSSGPSLRHEALRAALSLIAIAIVTTQAFGAAAAEPVIVPADHQAILYAGRWQTVGDERIGQWAAPFLSTTFSGGRLAVRLGVAPSSFVVRIDGGADAIFTGRTGTVDVTPASLAALPAHRLRMVALCGKELHVRGFELAPGATLTAPPTRRPSILFIGDSITFGASASEPTLGSWAWMASEMLGADCVRIAQGGIGLVDGYSAPLGTRGMEVQFFKLGAFGSSASEVDCSRDPSDTPAVVVVNLGTNDANANSGKPAPLPLFRARYAAFLTQLRARYPAATVLACELFNAYATDKIAAIRAAVADANPAGDARLQLISTVGWVNPDPAGGDIAADWSHPTDQGHAKLAAQAARALRPFLAR